MKLCYTPQARMDLKEIEAYISTGLCNPSAADHVISNILKSCSRLKEQPGMGISLAGKTGRDTELKYIITGKYLVFYKIEVDSVAVIRVLDSRTNYMRVIFDTEKTDT